jgi:hypothetical protein
MKNTKSTEDQEQAGEQTTRKPFFARYLEGQELEAVSGGGKTTMKYPSDGDEYVTMKYPSDSDETSTF